MEELTISYDKVYYYGLDKTRLHFENLVINDIQYGNYTADVSSDLGSVLHEYVLSHEAEVQIISTGDDLVDNTITLNIDETISSLRTFVSNWIDELVKIRNYDNGVACASYYNSSNEIYRNESRRFITWRDQVWSIFNDLATKVKNGKISTTEYGSDYVLSSFPPLLWDEGEDKTFEDQKNQEQVDIIESRTLEDWKDLKTMELTEKADAFENNVNKDMWFVSSVEGYYINGDRRTRSNIQDLIDFSESEPITYRDYQNIERELTKDQLRIMLKEHIINGQNLYKQKWAMLDQINACTTIEEIKHIDILFKMTNFYAEV